MFTLVSNRPCLVTKGGLEGGDAGVRGDGEADMDGGGGRAGRGSIRQVDGSTGHYLVVIDRAIPYDPDGLSVEMPNPETADTAAPE